MKIAQFLDALVLAVNIEIVIAALPESFIAATLADFGGGDLLKHLQCNRQTCPLRFADQQVYVFRHDHISGDKESIPTPHTLEFYFEETSCGWSGEVWLPMETTESDEVKITGLLEPFERPGHELNLARTGKRVDDAS